MSKITDALGKVGDAINPFDDIGASAAKGAAVEAAKAIDAFMVKYPLLGAIAKGKPISLAVEIKVTPVIGE